MWGQPLRPNTAAELLPPPYLGEYDKTAIGKRGGTSLAVFDRVDPSRVHGVSPTDPAGKPAATPAELVAPWSSLRAGMSGAGRVSDPPYPSIRAPVARVHATAEEIAARVARETQTQPVEVLTPTTPAEVIEILKAAEEGWGAGDEAGYAELVADAQRVKSLQAATRRRPMMPDELELLNRIAYKYSAAVDRALEASASREREIARVLTQGPTYPGELGDLREEMALRFAPSGRAERKQAAAVARALQTPLGDIQTAIGALQTPLAALADLPTRQFAREIADEQNAMFQQMPTRDQMMQGFSGLQDIGRGVGELASALTSTPVSIRIQEKTTDQLSAKRRIADELLASGAFSETSGGPGKETSRGRSRASRPRSRATSQG